MPPGALRRYLQFPQQDPQQQSQAAQYEAWAKKQAEDAAQEEDDKKSAAVQVPPAKLVAPGPQSMAQGYGVAQPSGTTPAMDFQRVQSDVVGSHAGADDDIKTQMSNYLSQLNNRPQMPGGGPPKAPPLPQRPQASAWEAIPQLLAGAGSVFSAGSNHPQDYLGPLMAKQQGARDQVYGDAMAQHHNMFQSEQAAYSDKLMRYSMDLRQHEQKLHDLKSYIDMATEQKFLQGQKTPQDTADAQKQETYRQAFDKIDMLKDVDEQERQFKATRPEGEHKYIEGAAAGKRKEISGRPRGLIEQGLEIEPGRGFFEPPGGAPRGMLPTSQKDIDFKRIAEGGATKSEKLDSLNEMLKDPKNANRKDKIKAVIEKVKAEPEDAKKEEGKRKSTIGEKLKREFEQGSQRYAPPSGMNWNYMTPGSR